MRCYQYKVDNFNEKMEVIKTDKKKSLKSMAYKLAKKRTVSESQLFGRGQNGGQKWGLKLALKMAKMRAKSCINFNQMLSLKKWQNQGHFDLFYLSPNFGWLKNRQMLTQRDVLSRILLFRPWPYYPEKQRGKWLNDNDNYYH